MLLLSLFWIARLLSFILAQHLVAAEESTSRPNVLFIMTDQQRYDMIGSVQRDLERYKDKIHVNTPNLDRLASSGVRFSNAYCQSPICIPARTSLFSGCTIERTGVKDNKIIRKGFLSKMPSKFANKIRELMTIEEVFAVRLNYTVEHYGKFHRPHRLYFDHEDPHRRLVDFNNYNYTDGNFTFTSADNDILKTYMQSLVELSNEIHVSTTPHEPGQQMDSAGRPYDTTPLDTRYNETKSVELDGKYSEMIGWGVLPKNLTSTGITGDQSVRALRRLLAIDEPFFLIASFTSPHPPWVASYESKTSREGAKGWYIPESLHDKMTHSPYEPRTTIRENPEGLRQWMDVYYSMVECIDEWVGSLLDTLEQANARNNTIIVFTSDHGEMLGAHSRRGKVVFYEPAVRVPLLLSFPGQIESNLTVDTPVSHIDVFPTILDYVSASHLDTSDGISTKGFIEKKRFNEDFDETAIVVELDLRNPGGKPSRMKHQVQIKNQVKKFGSEPNLMIRHGAYKLALSKLASSNTIDTLYNLDEDPDEMENLLTLASTQDGPGSNVIIGKAEHLKALLLEWMYRHDGEKRYYSDAYWNMGSGTMDIVEIAKRRTWPAIRYWQSDTVIRMGKPIWHNGAFRRNEYFYCGKTLGGKLMINDIRISGEDKDLFAVEYHESEEGQVIINKGDYIRIKVQFVSVNPLPSNNTLDAFLVIQMKLARNKKIVKVVSGDEYYNHTGLKDQVTPMTPAPLTSTTPAPAEPTPSLSTLSPAPSGPTSGPVAPETPAPSGATPPQVPPVSDALGLERNTGNIFLQGAAH